MAFAKLTRKTTNETPVHVNPDNVVCLEELHTGGTMITTVASKGDGLYAFNVTETLEVATTILELAQRG